MSTQNQALAALLFLYGEVLHRPLEFVQSGACKGPVGLPMVLSRASRSAGCEEFAGAVTGPGSGGSGRILVSAGAARHEPPSRCRSAGFGSRAAPSAEAPVQPRTCNGTAPVRLRPFRAQGRPGAAPLVG